MLISAEQRAQLRLVFVVVGLGLVLLASFGVLGAVLNEPFRIFTKEPVEQFEEAPAYVGVLAHFTWILWAIAGSVAGFSAAVLARTGGATRSVKFLVAASALTAVLLLDDAVMLHDVALPKLGIPEEALYLAYAVAFVVMLLRFSSMFREGDVSLALAAGAAWAVSLGADFVQEHLGIHGHAIEDGAKTIGTALWMVYLVRWAFSACQRAVSRVE